MTGEPRARRGAAWWIALGALVAVAVIVVAIVLTARRADTPTVSIVDGVESTSSDKTNPPQHDVDGPVACQVAIGVLHASGSITNHSTQPSNYRLVVAWENAGAAIQTATSVIDRVAPGATTMWEVTGVGSGNSDTTCRVVRVDRSKG